MANTTNSIDKFFWAMWVALILMTIFIALVAVLMNEVRKGVGGIEHIFGGNR